ncbi:MAG: 3-oxo-tetronate kinase [Lachnospiraceae bacterium]
MIILGCIADDFTGASDAASFLVKGGMSVRLYNGIPAKHLSPDEDTQAVVVALKSRTQETGQAVADSLNAARFLLAQGAKQIYFKYCSTFDSTHRGNIGPVADALMELLGADYTLLCPSLPVNGRTVENGKLMVHGIPLDESHMKKHPLTPMWDSNISKLMEPQSRYTCIPVDLNNPDTCFSRSTSDKPYYLIPDYRTDSDGETIAKTFSELALLTGGSGLLEPLARIWAGKLSVPIGFPSSQTMGKGLILAGSCSKATLTQIVWFQKQGLPSYKLDPEDMINGKQTAEGAWRFIEAHKHQADAVLIYSSDTPEKIREFQKYGSGKVADLLEQTIAGLAVRAIASGYTRIISAGGETSGAITKALGFTSYRIGQSIVPGVPIMVPDENPDLRLVLKSGNFGQEDFFGKALNMTLSNKEEE